MSTATSGQPHSGPIRIAVPIKPFGKDRHRVGRGGHVFTPARTRDGERAIAWEAVLAMRGYAPLTGPVRLTLTATMPIPRSWSAAKRAAALAGAILPTSKPDLSNTLKSCEDGIEKGGVLRDDAQIVEIVAAKRYGEMPCLLIEVSEIGGAL